MRQQWRISCIGAQDELRTTGVDPAQVADQLRFVGRGQKGTGGRRYTYLPQDVRGIVGGGFVADGGEQRAHVLCRQARCPCQHRTDFCRRLHARQHRGVSRVWRLGEIEVSAQKQTPAVRKGTAGVGLEENGVGAQRYGL